MARKSNYAFERNVRAKAKAEKREDKRRAKLAARASSAGVAPEAAPHDTEGNDHDARDPSAEKP